jgi:hypothetical protein
MPKVDNDPVKSKAKPFLIIAGVRCGGTFLAHGLSNHSQVFCDRGETMHQHYIWRREASMSHLELLDILTHQEGYHASGFRMVHSQAFNKQVWRAIVKMKPKIIHLSRANVLRQAVSFCFNQEVRKGRAAYYPVHVFKQRPPPAPATIAPETILHFCRQFTNANHTARTKFNKAKLQTLYVEYAAMVGAEGLSRPCAAESVANTICEFLGVRQTSLCSDLKRVHQWPLRAMLANWREVRPAIAASPWARWLEHEAQWKQDKDGRWLI